MKINIAMNKPGVIITRKDLSLLELLIFLTSTRFFMAFPDSYFAQKADLERAG
jgi:hypothetical protein